jgi:hypothetical protein
VWLAIHRNFHSNGENSQPCISERRTGLRNVVRSPPTKY